MSRAPKTMSSSDASPRKSLMRGVAALVRLPRRMVPSCVSEPTGSAKPRRARKTPAIIVVETAPRPGVSTPSFPEGGSITSGRFTSCSARKSRASLCKMLCAGFASVATFVLEQVTLTGLTSAAARGAVAAALSAEFPSVFVSFDGSRDDAPPHLHSSQWASTDFDFWSFDCAVDELAQEPFTLLLADDRSHGTAFPLE